MVGGWIRERRKSLELTQAALAGRVGVTQVQISAWETNKHAPSATHISRLIEVLGPIGAGPTFSAAPVLARGLQPAGPVGLGDFVDTGDGIGIGKVTAFDDGSATVTYFRSLDQVAATRQVPRSALRSVKLYPQTRCFFRGADERWNVGRIGAAFVDGEYEVLLPDRRAAYVPAQQIYVRSAAPVEDPLEFLVLGAQESPFLHDRRHAFLRSLVEQRAVAHGMTGLLSARIDLYPHQIEVVRRVLEDPVQRYLLADEVGLGKTIEAGVILRQYLLDHANPRALVIAPPMLVEQWRRELDQKFQAFAKHDAVRLLATDQVARLDAATQYGLVIVDEAHHAAALAFAQDKASRDLFDGYCRLASRADRVLLLSATPVLRHERDFLAMLHLLDPERYRLADAEAFRQRVEKRQAVGRILRALREDLSNPTLIKLNLGTLRREFKDDVRLTELANEVERVVAAEDGRDARRMAIRALRLHVSETYRLHRRLLRTRRRSVEDVPGTVLAPRSEQSAKKAALIEEQDVDERADLVHDLLDTWRSSAAASLPMAVPGEVDAWAEQRTALQRIFLTLFETAGSWLEVLTRVIRYRRRRTPDPMLRRDLGDQMMHTLCDVPLFDGEAKILDDLLDVLERAASVTRVEQMVDVVRNIARSATQPRPLKIAIFTGFTLACQQLADRFVAVFGSGAVARHQADLPPADVEADVTRFCDPSSNCRYLIVDRSGEEGRNLQAADIMVHFDLPWSPNRLEQRIGRLDRIGRVRSIRARICLGPDCDGSVFEAWYRVLRDGFGVFQSSIAALQFFVDEQLPELARKFFAGGTAALEAAVEPLRDAVAQEHVRLDDQDAVDEIDALVRDGKACTQALAELDAHHKDVERATHGWVAEALDFSAIRDEDAGTLRYVPSMRCLVPADVLLDRFKPFLGGYPATYEREISSMLPDIALLRVGDPFVDVLAEYLRWDDRGQAFAVWRQASSWPAGPGAEWLGFRFNYVIEADVSAASDIAAEVLRGADLAAVRRRADAWFPPMVRTLFIDADGNQVGDPKLLDILGAPYVSTEDGGRDTNLAKEKVAIIQTCIDLERWPAFCREIRDASQALLLGSEELRASCQRCAEQAEVESSVRIDQLRLRTADEQGTTLSTTSAREIESERSIGEAMIAGIRQPHVRLDSVGFIIVSGRSPFDRQQAGWGR